MCNPEREVGYGITDSWNEIVETLQEAPDSTDTELSGYITALQGQVTALQPQVATLQGQQGHQGLARDSTHPKPPEELGQHGLARDPTHLEPPEEAGGSA
nr:hypothetical protein [Tanacetum cinerariifolium]